MLNSFKHFIHTVKTQPTIEHKVDNWYGHPIKFMEKGEVTKEYVKYTFVCTMKTTGVECAGFVTIFLNGKKTQDKVVRIK